jgi:hypothetical protein
VLLACNFAFFTFNRVSFFENFALFFIVASLYAMHAAFRRASGACALASLALFSLAVLCKINALFALPAIAMLFAYFTFESVPRGGRLRFAFFSAGFFIALNILLSLLNGNLALHGSLVSMRMPDSLFVLARDLLIAPANQIFAYAPLFSLIGFASALLLAFESLREKQGEEKFFRQAFAVLLFFGFFAFAFFAYQPPRYFYMLFPALAVFSGIALDRLFSKKPLPAVKRPFSLAEKAMLLFSALFVPYALSANAVKYLVGMENVSVSVAAYCACFAAIFIACLAIARLIGRRATGIGGLGAAGAGIAMFALAAIILVQAGHYASWAASPQYTMLESSLAFGEFAGQFEQPVAVGDWCFALAVETNVVCYRTYYGDVMPEQRFRDIGAQMLLSEDSEWAQNKEIYLSYKSLEFVFVREFDMGKSRIGLYRIVQNGGE